MTQPGSRISTLGGADEAVELSVVMPCLNEADTLETCVRKAWAGLREAGVAGEIIVADNGSTDGSQEIAERLGARVVPVAERGYGHALMAGIAAARGCWVLMGDADDSYDFRELPKFLPALRQGCDLVQGCRLPSGGGRVAPGAMPFLHRWWGNPMFSAMVRRMFRAPIHDVYCGMRAFSKAFQARLEQRCTGMEFATEMVVKASVNGARIAEVPITLHPDGRKSHAPHLKTFRDGWRTLRFLLLYSPRWLFLVPGVVFMLLGFVGYALALPGVRVLGARLDAHTLLVASLAILVGFQATVFAIAAKVYAIGLGLLPEDPRLERFFRVVTLERGLAISSLLTVGGLGIVGAAAAIWWSQGFGDLDYARTLRLVIPGVLLVAVGINGVLSAFLVSLLGMSRR
jgi:glycosyltransferase involved in cell wall biosynthesis